MERDAALMERAGALMTEADAIDQALADIERQAGTAFDWRIFNLRARLVSLQAGLQVIADQLGFSFTGKERGLFNADGI